MEMKIFDYLIKKNGFFPNNETLPLLLYKNAFSKKITPEDIESILSKNQWKNSWRDSIYSYHHYHSNTHEVLVIYKGSCQVELGGPEGQMLDIQGRDVLIIPAGVSHKNHQASEDFKCIGAYPFNIQYDMNYGKANEYPMASEQILKVSLPETDPIFGKNGPLFKYWK